MPTGNMEIFNRIIESADVRKKVEKISWVIFWIQFLIVILAVVVTMTIAFTVDSSIAVESFVFNMAWIASLGIYILPVTWYYVQSSDVQEQLVVSTLISGKDRFMFILVSTISGTGAWLALARSTEVFVGYQPSIWISVSGAFVVAFMCTLFQSFRRFFVAIPAALIVCWAIFAAIARGRASSGGGSGVGTAVGITIIALVAIVIAFVIIWKGIKEAIIAIYSILCATYILVLTPLAYWSGDKWESRYVLADGTDAHTHMCRKFLLAHTHPFTGTDYLYIFSGMTILLIARTVYYFYEPRILKSVIQPEGSCCFDCWCGCCPIWCCPCVYHQLP